MAGQVKITDKQIKALLLQLLKARERPLRAAADAAPLGFDYGLRAVEKLVLVQAAIRWVEAK